MEYLDIYMLADARNVQIVDENLEAISGLVTLIKDVPVTINLHMYDVYGEPYTEDTLNKHIWSFIVAHDYNSKTTPQLRANAISVAGNVLKIEINNMNTVELNEQLKEEKSVRLGAELYGKSLDDNKDNWVIQFNVSIRNRRESNGIPTNVESNYYTKGEVDSKIDGITLDVPEKISDLENDAGYITIEQVPEVDLTPYALKSDIPDISGKLDIIGKNQMIIDDGVFTINTATSFDINSPFSSFAGGKVVCYNGLGVMGEITLNSNTSNTAGGLVVVGSNGKISESLYDKTEVDLTPYALKSEIPDVSNFITADALSVYALKSEIPVVDVNKTYVDTELAKKANSSDIPFVPSVVSAFTNDAGYITLSDVPEVDLSVYALKSEIPDVSNFITADALTPYALKTELPVVDVDKAYVDAELAKKLNTTDAFSGDYNDLTNKPDIPVLPDNLTTLGNDVNTAGGLVVIGDDGKIPAVLYDSGSGGTIYTAGSGINITDNVISVGLDGYQASRIDMYIQKDYAHLLMYNREFTLGKSKGNGRIYSANNCEDINIMAGTLFLGGAVKAGNMYLSTKNQSKGTVETSCNVSYTDGNFCTLKLTAETACTLTIGIIPIYATLMVIVDNAAGGSLLFGSEEVISNSETGKYALVFSNLGSSVKLYNKIEV